MITTANQHRYREQGATSLVIVMFSVLLFVIVAVGFIQLMTSEQRASTDTELSRGAYDSALAGVEDGKRVLKDCLDNPDLVNNPACAVIVAGKCSTVSDAGFVTQDAEGQVYLKSTTSTGGLSDTQYEQAYTCVKISLNTKDYRGYLNDDDGSSTVIIPLKTADAATQVNLQWFKSSAGVGSLDNFLTPDSLPTKTGWPARRPPVLRVELINLQGNPIATLDGSSGAWTMYLYPKEKGLGFSPQYNFLAVDGRDHSGSPAVLNTPKSVWCNEDVTTNLSPYVCDATVTLPAGVDTTNGGIYLRVTSMYNSADISVSPQVVVGGDTKSTEYVQVQPSIDSTGRASDVFRRVEARVESTDDEVAYPRATIDITNNLCKVLSVTDTYSGTSGSCTP